MDSEQVDTLQSVWQIDLHPVVKARGAIDPRTSELKVKFLLESITASVSYPETNRVGSNNIDVQKIRALLNMGCDNLQSFDGEQLTFCGDYKGVQVKVILPITPAPKPSSPSKFTPRRRW